jgi:hypothetical protein
MSFGDIVFRAGKAWQVSVKLSLIVLIGFSLLAARASPSAEKADAHGRVFELRIYHVVPGKLSVMESRFRDTTSRILARHNLNVIGYWVSQDEKGDSFVFLLSHKSKEEALKNWAAFGQHPEFQQVAKAEQAEKTLERADVIWLRPTDFSATK